MLIKKNKQIETKNDKLEKPGLSERIIAASRELFFKKGYFVTNTREIAKRAGTSESGVFRLFKSKFVLLMAIYNSCWKQVNEHIESALTNDADPRDKLLIVIKSFWELYELEPLMMSFIISNFGSADTLLISKESEAIITEEGSRYIERIDKLCQQIVSKNLIDSRVTAESLRENVFGLAEGILVGWYLSDKSRYSKKVSIEEALIPLKIVLYNSKT